MCAGPEDVFLALRGLAHHGASPEAKRNGRPLAMALLAGGTARRSLQRAAPGPARLHEGHAIWKRDFLGSSGLFSVILRPASARCRRSAMLDGLELFGLGAIPGPATRASSIPFDCSSLSHRKRPGAPAGRPCGFSIGLEDIEDLKADLERGFGRLKARPAEAVRAEERPVQPFFCPKRSLVPGDEHRGCARRLRWTAPAPG